MRDFLATHWLGLALVVVAGGLVALAVARRSRWAAAGAYLSGLLGLGGLLLTGASVEVWEEKVTVAQAVLVAGVGAFVVALVVLAFLRAWSFWAGAAFGGLALLGVGGLVVRPLAAWLAEAGRSVRGLEFVRPEWLALLAFVPVVFLLGRRSLSGLGPTRKWVAISARAVVIALLALALAEPRLRRQSEHVTVLFVVDRSFSVPQDLDPDRPVTDAADRRWEKVRGFVEQSVERRYGQSRNDQFGVILFGKRPRLALPPAPVFRTPVDERMAGPIDGNYTDIAAAIKLALASFPEGTGKRIVLVSDGNENLGSAEDQAALARQNGVQIDTVALAPGFKNENEVLVEAVVAPSGTAVGQPFLVKVMVRNATPDRVVDGRLELLKVTGGQPRPLRVEDSADVIEPGIPAKVRLPARGITTFKFEDVVEPRGDTAHSYRATFTPTESRSARGGSAVGGLPGDRTANNRASAAVVSRGQRRVLVLDEAKSLAASPHAHLIRVLRSRSNIDVRWWPAENLPADKGELGVFLSNYDCVVLANVPAERLTNDQMEVIRSNVYDQGCGLIMVGGPDSFGAGGYQGTPVEAALPVDCEVKALKAAGKGGLVLIMHASEMADGNKWQKDIAKLAITRLGPEDMVGVTQYGFGGGNGVNWHIPFQRVGEAESESRKKLLAKVDSMMPGDMPDFDPFLRAACDTLKDERHGLSVKHTIVISDGDPNYSGPGQKAIDEMAEKGITCTTVGVATHGVNEDAKMKKIAEGTKDGNGKTGTFYKVTNPNQLPGIYIKESRRVSQSFIHDKPPFRPTRVGVAGPGDVLAPGLPEELPNVHGFVRTTRKENVLASVSLNGFSPYPDQQFPILASWRYGLGKAVAFTSDARTIPGVTELGWDREWAAADMYQRFWEQVVNWAMREEERGRLALVADYDSKDGRVRVIATVQDEKGQAVSGLSLRGAVTPPGTPAAGEKPPAVVFKPKGGGVYEAEFSAEEAGAYFVNVQALEPERGPDGRVVLNPDGTPKMKTVDAARSGVTVPYSPEFGDLESNTPLMRRLAELTGGQFHTEADDDLQQLMRSGELFREAPTTTRSLLPFWFWLVFAAGVLLLFDVGVRRIAVEWAEVRRYAVNVWAGLRRQPIVVEESAALGQLLRRKAAVGEAIDRGRAGRKFDPTQAPAADPAPAGADEYVSRMPTGPVPTAPVGDRTQAPKEDEDDELSRLRKAKLRAKHQQQKRDDEDRS